MPSPFPCSPVIREWLCEKTHIEKKNKKKPRNLVDLHMAKQILKGFRIYK